MKPKTLDTGEVLPAGPDHIGEIQGRGPSVMAGYLPDAANADAFQDGWYRTGDVGWLAAFHSRGGPVNTYVDIATPPVWDGDVVRSVDLDLDVVSGWTGRVWIDDEDEFAERRVAYPDEIVRHALDTCRLVEQLMSAAAAPFDGSADAWLERLRSFT